MEVESLCERLMLSTLEGMAQATVPGEVPRGLVVSGPLPSLGDLRH